MLQNKSKIALFLTIVLVVVLLHCRAHDAGFVTDFTGLWEKMQNQGLGAAIRSFGFPSLMPLLNVFYFILYQLFGLSGWPWFLTFVFFYSVGLFYWHQTVLELVSSEKRKELALATTALILVSPFQVEALIWKVGLGHISSVCFFMLALYYAVCYLKRAQLRYLWIMLLFMSCSLFCFEWALVFPVIILLLGWHLRTELVYKAFGAMAGVAVLYILLTKIFIGKAIGHYDISSAQVLNVPMLLGTYFKYFIKHLGLVHFLDYELKNILYGLVSKLIVQLFVATLGVFSFYKLYKVKSPSSRLGWTLLLCSFFSLLLVLPLFFQYTLLSENDRYGSMFVPFISLWIVLFLSRLPRVVGVVLFCSYMLLNFYFQQQLVTQWKDAQAVIHKVETTLPSALDTPALILNLPENYKGTFMFRDFSGQNPLIDHMKMRGHHLDHIDLVGQYNLPAPLQTYTANRLDDRTIELVAAEWGSWWWRKGIGATNYETEHYGVQFINGRKLSLKMKKTGYYKSILFFDGQQWKEL